MKKLLLSLVLSLSSFNLLAQADSTAATTPDFGVFAQLADYGPLGLAVLALGYVAWMFIKRHLAEKDRLQEELKAKSTPKPTRKTKK
jgi:hypothetical protein